MRYNILFKFLAVLLCAVSLVAMVGSTAGMVFLEAQDLYSQTLESKTSQTRLALAQNIAERDAQLYAAETYGSCPTYILFDRDPFLTHSTPADGRYGIEIVAEGKVVLSEAIPEQFAAGGVQTLTFSIPTTFPVLTDYQVSAESDPALPRNPQTVLPKQPPVSSEDYTYTRWDEHTGQERDYSYTLNYYQGPVCQVRITLPRTAALTPELALISALYPYGRSFGWLLLASLLTTAVSLVYLFVSAGRRPGSPEIRPAGPNRLALDFYALCAAGIDLGLFFLLVKMEFFWVHNWVTWDNVGLWIFLGSVVCLLMTLPIIGVLTALAAQSKLGGGYWWRHSCTGWVLARLHRGLRFLSRGLLAGFRLLPFLWQWLAAAAAMALSSGLTLLLALVSWGAWQGFWIILFFLSLAGDAALVFYGSFCFGTLMKGAAQLADGNLQHKIPTEHLVGAFRTFAEKLNTLGQSTHLAVEKQLKSERMKTELITNVSHDIKTPLTSIINYVDLLQRPHTPEDGAQYLEVLDRQSHQLKKLIEDLMDMSKASSGNMTVEMADVDVAETINQALGELGDKLEKARLTPVFQGPDFPVVIRADGRLLWRILSNLLNNAAKYALPGTRLYVDLSVLQHNAVISLKNISREQLNVGADELMERFVRGDASRNTEGSGLGLNIAKSLAELQGGSMKLIVDGDLFKVTLVFPLV